MKFGYSDIQAYMILGTAPVEGRLSGVVDIPNACSTLEGILTGWLPGFLLRSGTLKWLHPLAACDHGRMNRAAR
mgnify:FL=1